MNNKLTKPTNSTLEQPSAAQQPSTAALSRPKGLHDRIAKPKTSAEGGAAPETLPNRIALLLDVSGSMGSAEGAKGVTKIEALRDAVTGFITACNMADTSLALEPFGDDYPSPNRLALTTFRPLLLTTAASLRDNGSTPLARAMRYALESYSMTRCVLVSDGEPDSADAAYSVAEGYKLSETPVDCVHIGDSTSGEACLRRIAEMTGGVYIKFENITSFSGAFKFLTPGYYGLLRSGGFAAEDLGAKEIK